MKIDSKDFRVRPEKKVKLKEWPTIVKPFCKSKKRYHKLLEEHVEHRRASYLTRKGCNPVAHSYRNASHRRLTAQR
jgi:hypothetical protein